MGERSLRPNWKAEQVDCSGNSWFADGWRYEFDPPCADADLDVVDLDTLEDGPGYENGERWRWYVWARVDGAEQTNAGGCTSPAAAMLAAELEAASMGVAAFVDSPLTQKGTQDDRTLSLFPEVTGAV